MGGQFDYAKLYLDADTARIKLLDLVEFLQTQNRILLNENIRLTNEKLNESTYHGMKGYKDKCRCDVCLKAMAEYNRKYREIYKMRAIKNAKVQG